MPSTTAPVRYHSHLRSGRSPVRRVRERCCRRSLLYEPDVRVSPHPARPMANAPCGTRWTPATSTGRRAEISTPDLRADVKRTLSRIVAHPVNASSFPFVASGTGPIPCEHVVVGRHAAAPKGPNMPAQGNAACRDRSTGELGWPITGSWGCWLMGGRGVCAEVASAMQSTPSTLTGHSRGSKVRM
jgi:hypothetical protein